MILSVEELEEEVPTRCAYAEDTGATQAMPAARPVRIVPSPPFAEAEEPVLKVEESNFRTMAMRIPTAEELAAAAPIEIVEPAPCVRPTGAAAAARLLRTGADLARSAPAVPLLQAGSGLRPSPPPPPAF